MDPAKLEPLAIWTVACSVTERSPQIVFLYSLSKTKNFMYTLSLACYQALGAWLCISVELFKLVVGTMPTYMCAVNTAGYIYSMFGDGIAASLGTAELALI